MQNKVLDDEELDISVTDNINYRKTRTLDTSTESCKINLK